MKKFLEQKRNLILTLLFVVLLALCTSLYMQSVQKSYVTELRTRIVQQQDTLRTLSKMASTDTADEYIDKIITDCRPEHRERFDTLLGALASLKNTELNEVDNLFTACGSFYSTKTAVMVNKLQREFEIYKGYIQLLLLADTKIDKASFAQDQWEHIVALHTKRSELSQQLVLVQGRIIIALKNRTPIQADSMQELLREGQDTRDSLLVVTTQIVEAEAKLRGI